MKKDKNCADGHGKSQPDGSADTLLVDRNALKVLLIAGRNLCRKQNEARISHLRSAIERVEENIMPNVSDESR